VGLFDRRRRSPFTRRDDGRFDVDLPDDVRAMVLGLISQVRDLLTTDSPALRRLFPPPYGDDEERNAGYSVLAGAELMESRLAGIAEVETTIDDRVLTGEQLESWMRSINDVRLVLGTILGIEDESGPGELSEEAAPMYSAYELLGAVLDAIVDALTD
jgi:hypothetical protein